MINTNTLTNTAEMAPFSGTCVQKVHYARSIHSDGHFMVASHYYCEIKPRVLWSVTFCITRGYLVADVASKDVPYYDAQECFCIGRKHKIRRAVKPYDGL